MLAGSTQLAWRDETHGRNAEPDYDRVFAQDVVKRLDIRIAPAEWARLIADMTDMAGAFGGDRSGFDAAPDPARVAACGGLVEGSMCSFGAPSQTGRCTLLPMGAGLSCTPLPDGGGLPGGGGPGMPAPGNIPPGRGNPPGGGDSRAAEPMQAAMTSSSCRGRRSTSQ